MTNLSTHIAIGGNEDTGPIKQHIAGRRLEMALFVVVAAALTGAWLAFFMFVPLDLRLR
jgi:hypothetical protein